MRRVILAPVCAALALAGCGAQEQEPQQPETAGNVEAGSDLSGFASTYTELDLEACEQTDLQVDQGGSASWTCNGFGDVPLYVDEGDGRFDLDAGVQNALFETIGAFNDINESIEWRLKDGEPIAVIFRFNDVTLESVGRSVLAIEKVGATDAPGCRVAQIAGDTPDANQVARDLADQTAPSFTCGVDEPTMVGAAS